VAGGLSEWLEQQQRASEMYHHAENPAGWEAPQVPSERGPRVGEWSGHPAGFVGVKRPRS
jgi:hypothetical protein